MLFMAEDQRIPKSLIIFGLQGSSKVQASRLKISCLAIVLQKNKTHSHKRRVFQGNLGRCDVALTRLRVARRFTLAQMNDFASSVHTKGNRFFFLFLSPKP